MCPTLSAWIAPRHRCIVRTAGGRPKVEHISFSSRSAVGVLPRQFSSAQITSSPELAVLNCYPA
jgi:hypothetical protein